MAIIGTLPNIIQNGQLEDATPLMANFNFMLNQVNANANPIGTFTAPAGTRMLFNQSAPPIGWTQETGAAYQDCSLRTVSGPGGGVGGSVGWSSWNFGGVFNGNPFTLSVAQLPSHTHPDTGHSHVASDPGHIHGSPNGAGFWEGSPTALNNILTSSGGGGISVATPNSNTAAALTGVSVQTSFANISYAGSGSSIQSSLTTPLVKYTDYVIGIKS